MSTSSLILSINGEILGTIERSSSNRLSFQYASSWIKKNPGLPISWRFPVQEEAFRGEAVRAYLDNLLPDSDAILTRIAAIHGIRSTDSFDLLATIGRDCVGALQFSVDEKEIKRKAIQKESISAREIAQIIRDLKSHPLGQHSNDEFFRISIAGAHEKTALLNVNGQWHKPMGNTATTHILKPSITLDFDGKPVSITPENEWLCLKICKHFGLKTANASIETFEDINVLCVERFDRRWSKDKKYLDRIIQEDFCQATGTPPHLKYENRGGPGMRQILQILNESRNARADRYHFFKTQIVFWLLAAIDGHAKNFSIQWSKEGHSLAPLYDVISAAPLIKAKKLSEHKIGLAMAVLGKNRHYRIQEIKPKHWRSTAQLTKIPEGDVTKIFDEVIEMGKTLETKLSSQLPSDFPNSILDPIFSGIQNRLKIIESA